MGATEGRRRFVTRTDVEDAARSGESLSLGPRDVITDEASQRALDLGVAVTRAAAAVATRAPSAAPDPALRPVVRKAVIAELGHEPDGLDAALDRVFG